MADGTGGTGNQGNPAGQRICQAASFQTLGRCSGCERTLVARPVQKDEGNNLHRARRVLPAGIWRWGKKPYRQVAIHRATLCNPEHCCRLVFCPRMIFFRRATAAMRPGFRSGPECQPALQQSRAHPPDGQYPPWCPSGVSRHHRCDRAAQRVGHGGGASDAEKD